MIVKVDVRESDLLQQINQLLINVPIFKNIVVKSEVLPIGDIIIASDKEDKLIIERKSVTDLLASIKDGRYEEQSYRLNGSAYHNHNIVYLIEGDVNKVNRFKSDNAQASEKLTIYSAMFSLNYYKGFSVFRSFSLGETATIICNMAYKLAKEETKKAFYQNTNTITEAIKKSEAINKSEPINKTEAITNLENAIIDQPEEQDVSEKDYVSVIKKVKKENITPDNIGEIMLCQIPGISAVTALTIMEKFQTLPNLIKEMELNNDCLKDICSTNSKGQTRKINKTSIANIVKFLLKK
jgi:ERCC4-type nuclease